MMTKVLQKPVFQPKRGFKLAPLSAALILAGTLSSPAAHAVIEFNLGDIEGSLDSQLSLGVTIRTENQDQRLFDGVNGADRGLSGGTGKSKTTDDGNLNFNKGDVVSNVFKGTHGLSLQKDNFGAFARVKYWYDFRLKDGDVRHGSTTSGFAAANSGDRIKLDDSKLDDLAKFSGIELMDAFVYGEFDVNEMPLDVRLGRQVVSWGESTFIGGGINQINPIDVAAFRRPGATLKDVLMPVNLAYGSIGLTDNLSAEAFYQLEWEPYALDGCGTFFMGSDVVPSGCTGVNGGSDTVTFGTDGSFIPWDGSAALFANQAIPRGADQLAKDEGQFGLAGRYYVDSIETEFGAYFLNYHSRKPYFSITRSDTGVQPTYQLAYPENLKVYGLSYQTTVAGFSLGGEVTYQPDYPVGWNSTEALHSFINAEAFGGAMALPVAPSFHDRVVATAPGQTLLLADEFDVYQIQSTIIQFWDQVLGASRLSLVAEAGATFTDGINENTTDQNVNRYGRGINFGNCNLHGATDDTVDCSGGFVTKFAWGYRAKASLAYSDVFAGVNLTPSFTWKHDVDGVAPNGNFIEGRQSFSIALAADYLGQYNAAISYTSFLKSQFDATHDRDHLALSVGMSF